MENNLKNSISEWKEYRKLTFDLLDNMSEENLDFTVGKNMGTFGKQFRHIGDVELCYIEAIKNKKIDFSKYRRDYKIEKSKEKLKDFLNEMDNELFIVTEKLNDKEADELKIDWGFKKMSLEEHLNNMINHEILHHGELIVYTRVLGLRFPKSWELWGL